MSKRIGQMKNCETCERSFYVPERKTRTGRGRCCSKKCWNKLKRVIFSGPGNPFWSGGRHVMRTGRIEVRCPEYPGNRRNYAFEHRLIMAKHLGRVLLPTEIVHHLDRNIENNSIENLRVMTMAEHSMAHPKARDARGRFLCNQL